MNRKRFSKYILIFILLVFPIFLIRFICGHNYYQQDIALGAVGPSWDHWFGTDQLGRDLFSRVLYACYISLSVGILATFFAVSFGTFYGILSGYYGGRIDNFLMRVVDILYPIPLTLIVILLMALLGKHMGTLFFAISVVQWMMTARIIRSEVLKISGSGYIQVAKGLGQNTLAIMRIHILPNISDSIALCFIITLPGVILMESFLSFLGLGIQPPKSSLGMLIAEGAKYMATYPWQVIFPATILIGIILVLTIYGDRDKP